MSSQEHQQCPDRRRPFSVSDLNRRTREVKIYNTTTITTTTHSHDSSRVTNTVYSNENINNENNYTENVTTVNGSPVYSSNSGTTRNIYRTGEPLRSKSAFSTNSDHYQYNSLPVTITTNSSITAVPSANRKIQFIYGKDQEQSESNNAYNVHTETHTNNNEFNQDQNFCDQQSRTFYNVGDHCESFPVFPNIKHSFSTEISDPFFTNNAYACNHVNRNNACALKKQSSEDSYDNYNSNSRTERSDLNRKNMRVKDVEVECEIEEDPAIFEGSEGYVKNLISKIQQQYKNPETVHIKITRRQKPENIDSNGNLKQTPNESYGQIVRKEYYTIRTTNRRKKTSSMSSFVDTANIPYIDGSDDDRSARNSRIEVDKNLQIPNYTIEKHVIYNDGNRKVKDREAKVSLGKEVGIRDLVSSLGGVIRKENLELDRSESMSPSREIKIRKESIKKPDLRSKSIDLSEENIKVNGGLSGFFKCGPRSGRTKSPEVKKEKPAKVKTPKEPKIPKGDKKSSSKIEINTKLPTIDVDVNKRNVEGSEIKITTQEVDVNSPEYKNGMKDLLSGLSGKIKEPEVDMTVTEVNIKAPDADVSVGKVDINVNKPEVDLEALTAEIDASLPKVEVKGPKVKAPKERKPKKDFEIKPPNISLPDFNLPKFSFDREKSKIDVDAEIGKPKAEIEIEAPEYDINLPDVEIKRPEIEIETKTATLPDANLDIDVNSPEYKNGMKGFLMGLGGKIKAPEVDVPITEVNVKAPDADIKVKPPKTRKPKVPKVPSVDLDIKGPDVDVNLPQVDIDVKSPELDYDINSPEYKGGVKGFFKGIGGKIDVHSTPTKQVELSNIDVEAENPKLKTPKINNPKEDLPSCGLCPRLPSRKAKKIPSVDMDVVIPTGKASVEVQKPSANINFPQPEIDIKTATDEYDIDVNSPEVKGGLKGFFKGLGGKIKTPEVNFPETKAKNDLEMPDVSVNLPNIELETPKVEVDFPEVDLSVDSKELSLPKAELEIDVNSAEYKNGMKSFLMGLGGKIETPEVDVPVAEINVNSPDADVNIKKLDLEVDPSLPRFDVEKPEVDIEIKPPKADVDLNFKSVDYDVNSPEYKNGLKGFFMGLGGKIDASDKSAQFEKPELDITVANVEVKTPSIEVEIEKPTVDVPEVDVDKNSFKGFFKGIGGKIKAPEVNLSDIHVSGPDFGSLKSKTPKVEVEVTEVDVSIQEKETTLPKLPELHMEVVKPTYEGPIYEVAAQDTDNKVEGSEKTDIYIRGLNLSEHKQFVYGLDLPMTIVNNDWHWSPESVKEGAEERKIFFRQYTDDSNTSSNYINSGSFPMGNLSLISNTEVSNNSSTFHASRPVVDYEFKTAKLTKSNVNASVSSKPGNLALKERDQSVPKSKSSTGSFFRRKLSSASSISNLDLKKSFQAKANIISRSESADPSSRTKIDYSVPRKCRIVTKPDFNGLGIHIACDKKTRRFPYIYEIEPNSPGQKSGLRKNDFILEVNDEDVVDLEFKELISRIQDYIKDNSLCLTVGNEKAHKKWIKARTASLNRTKSKV